MQKKEERLLRVRRRIVGRPPALVRAVANLEGMELREADDDGEAAAEAVHDGGGHERDEAVGLEEPDQQHEHARAHHGRE